MPTDSARREPRRVIIDTDPGIDDALALALAFRSPELRVEAITTVGGNVGVELGTRNALLVLEALGVKNPPPVARGAGRPLARDPVDASHVHGEDGVGGITRLVEPGGRPRYPPPTATASEQPAVDLILDLVRKNPGEITVIAVGPLTNVAQAIERDPAAMAQLAGLIVMGGSLSGIGNATPVAEFNFFADPHAAQQVVCSGLKMTLVGLDVTEKTLLTRDYFEKRLARSNDPAARLIADVIALYFTVAEARRGEAACPLHDPLAVGVAIDPSFVRTESFPAEVEEGHSQTEGMLIADRRRFHGRTELRGKIEGCVEVDAERFVKLFLDRLLPPS